MDYFSIVLTSAEHSNRRSKPISATYIGITGTIGSGKSTILGIISSWINSPDEERRLKGMVLSADEIAKELLYNNDGEHDGDIISILGDEVIMQTPRGNYVNYNRIRDILINDPEKRKKYLEFTAEIVWPEIVRRVGDFDGFVYVESALIYDARWDDGRFKHIVCIWCKPETSLERLVGKKRANGSVLTKEEVEGLLRVQKSASEMRCRSDFCLYNGYDTRQEEIPEYVRHLIASWDPSVFKTRPPYESEKNEKSPLA